MKSSLPPDTPGNARVRAAFDRAAPSYDAAAEFQRLICDRLIEMLGNNLAPRDIADLGCGTGYTSERLALRFPTAHIAAVDFAPAMLNVARSRGRASSWIAADVQRLPFAPGTMDLVCSSVALQWCDPAAAFAEAARVLRPGGRVALASVGPGTLSELETAFAGIDSHDHVLKFHPLDELKNHLEAHGLRVEHASVRPLTLHRPDLSAILRELKAIGANNAGPRRRRGILGRATWRQVEQRYERLRRPEGLPVTYCALYLLAVRL